MKLKNKNLLLLIFASLLYIFIIKISSLLLNFDKVLYNSLIDNLSEKQINKYLKIKNALESLNFIIYPIFIFIKTTIISSVIYIGVYFYSKRNLTFGEILNSVLKAEFIFILVPICKLLWFYFFVENFSLEDIQLFFPFSGLNIIGTNGVDPWLVYPLQTINLFEVAYIFFLSIELGYLTKTNADTGLKIMLYSYVPALLLWITIIVFFTLNYS
jgi:hypothetical protein